jgi:hypothetical protein
MIDAFRFGSDQQLPRAIVDTGHRLGRAEGFSKTCWS